MQQQPSDVPTPPSSPPRDWQRQLEDVAQQHDRVVDENAALAASLEKERLRRREVEARLVRDGAGGRQSPTPSAGSAGGPPADAYSPGEFVFVERLVQLQRLNNKVGKVLGRAGDRVLVEILKGEKVAMRPRNLTKIPAALAEQVAQLHYDVLVTSGADMPPFADVHTVESLNNSLSVSPPAMGGTASPWRPPERKGSASPPRTTPLAPPAPQRHTLVHSDSPPARPTRHPQDARRVWSPSQRPRVPAGQLPNQRGGSHEPPPPPGLDPLPQPSLASLSPGTVPGVAHTYPPPPAAPRYAGDGGGSPGRGGWGGPPPGPTAHQYPPVYPADESGRDLLLGVGHGGQTATPPPPPPRRGGYDTAAYSSPGGTHSPPPAHGDHHNHHHHPPRTALSSFAGALTGHRSPSPHHRHRSGPADARRASPGRHAPPGADGGAHFHHPRALLHIAEVRARYNVLKRYYTALYHTVLRRYVRLRPLGLEGRWHVAHIAVDDAQGPVPVLLSASCAAEQTGNLTAAAGSAGWTASSPASCAWLRLALPYQRRVAPRVVLSHYPSFLPPHQAAALYASCRPSIPTHIKVEGSANGTSFVHLATVPVTPATAGCVEVLA